MALVHTDFLALASLPRSAETLVQALLAYSLGLAGPGSSMNSSPDVRFRQETSVERLPEPHFETSICRENGILIVIERTCRPLSEMTCRCCKGARKGNVGTQ